MPCAPNGVPQKQKRPRMLSNWRLRRDDSHGRTATGSRRTRLFCRIPAPAISLGGMQKPKWRKDERKRLPGMVYGKARARVTFPRGCAKPDHVTLGRPDVGACGEFHQRAEDLGGCIRS